MCGGGFVRVRLGGECPYSHASHPCKLTCYSGVWSVRLCGVEMQWQRSPAAPPVHECAPVCVCLCVWGFVCVCGFVCVGLCVCVVRHIKHLIISMLFLFPS